MRDWNTKIMTTYIVNLFLKKKNHAKYKSTLGTYLSWINNILQLNKYKNATLKVKESTAKILAFLFFFFFDK